MAGTQWASWRGGGEEGREVTGQIVQGLGATGRTLVFALSEVGAMEGSGERRDVP